MIYVNEMLKQRIQRIDNANCEHTYVLNNRDFELEIEEDGESSLHSLLGTGSVHVGQHVASSAVLAICPSTLGRSPPPLSLSLSLLFALIPSLL